jgi:threonine synthase
MILNSKQYVHEDIYSDFNYLIDPHTAVASQAVES